MPNQVKILKHKFANSIGLPFREVLPESAFVEALAAEKVEYRDRLFNPIVMWAFLSQVLDSDKSLQNAVSRIIAWLAEAGEPIPSTDTGGYSKARKRLPEGVFNKLLGQTAQKLSGQAEPQDLWRGRACEGL